MDEMKLFKAHFIHPRTQIPFIVYYNKSNGYVTFEKDNDIIHLLMQLEKRLIQDQQFAKHIEQANTMCETTYEAKTFKDVYELLEVLGVRKNDLNFKELFIH